MSDSQLPDVQALPLLDVPSDIMKTEPLACQSALDGLPGETAVFQIPAPSVPFWQFIVTGRQAFEIKRLRLRVDGITVFVAEPTTDGRGHYWMRVGMDSQAIGTVRGNDCFVFEAVNAPGFSWRSHDTAILWIEFSSQADPQGRTRLYAV